MRASVSPQVKVKAAGGVRTSMPLIEVMDAGADRCGATETAEMLDEFAPARPPSRASRPGWTRLRAGQRGTDRSGRGPEFGQSRSMPLGRQNGVTSTGLEAGAG